MSTSVLAQEPAASLPDSVPITGPNDGFETSADYRLAAEALACCLAQLAELLTGLTDEQYCQCGVGEVTSSIGGHVRHCLDHVEAILVGAATGLIDYDDRRRGTAVEKVRSEAIASISREVARLGELPRASLDCSLWLRTMVVSDQPPLLVRTSLTRELSFVLSHTIHHGALIAVMARTLRSPVPERFGYAPATLAYLASAACAPSP